MVTFFNAVSAVFMIFSIMAVGYLMGRAGWMTGTEKKFISRFVVNIAVPMNCITGVLQNLKRDAMLEMGTQLLVPVVGIFICLVLSDLAARWLKLPKKRYGIFIAMAFISNTLFIGLPIANELFGDVSIPYVMMYYMGSTIYTQTVAVMLCKNAGEMSSEKKKWSTVIKDIFTKPPVLGLIAAFTLLALDVRPPQIFMSFAKYMSNTVTPLALMYCGFIVYELGIRNIRLERGIPMMLLIRLIIAPAICAGLCVLFGVHGLNRSVFIIEAALPVVSQITVMAGNYGADEKYAAAGSVLSMLGIFITVPILMVILT
ncbi:MAG: AEC family transporter [[Clostridium] aminophilum]|uniref:AEC family transporter n=1 Tax=[Clostridium] aminophilum TaxID=1526 RepID=UPI0026ED777C|nr:AEC family transporter [[Clostridium] aminophilum]MDD6195741.1 AEC family transporter [[Clostridium] aminophilum]